MRETTENMIGLCKEYDKAYADKPHHPRCPFMVDIHSTLIPNWCANAGCRYYGRTCPLAVKQLKEEEEKKNKLSVFNYKDTSVGVDRYHTGNLPKELRRTCFCCNEEMNNCDVVLLINNLAHIPNTLIHADCFAKWSNKTDELCKDIENAYEDYKRLKAVFN